MIPSRNALLVTALTLLTATAGAAQAKTGKSHAAAACDRACLDGMADRYLDAMVAKTPAALPWAPVVRFSENSVPMAIGDGLWGSSTAHAATALRAADPISGQVAWMGVVEEHGQPAFLALRLKVEGGRIAEVETVVRRKGGPPQYSDPAKYAHDPAFAEASAGRPAPAALKALANGYFDALEGKSGAQPRLAPDCERLDNGVATTKGATAEGGVEGCAAQFGARVFKPVSRVRERRYPVADTARGVIIATGFLDLPAHADKPETGKGLAWAATYPYSIGFMTAFKSDDGRIRRIDSISAALPYRMPSPWSEGAARRVNR
jgi:hypothetical protein